MARHPYGPQARRRARNRTYTVLALLIVVVIIAFMYGPFGADADEESAPVESGYQADSGADLNTSDANEALEVVSEEPEPSETAVMEPEPEIVQPEPELEIVAPEAAEPVVPAVVPTEDVAAGTTAAETSLPESALEPEPGTTIEANPEADTLIAQAAALIEEGSGSFLDAREDLNQALRMPLSPKQREYVKAQLSELSNKWLFSRTILPNDPLSETYRVKPGDIFEAIGRQYKVPYEILMEINRISNPRALQAGQALKVIKGPFHAKVYRSTFTMDIYLQNTYVRSFTVGLGKLGTETPTGLWRLRPGGKAHATSWRDPDTGKLYQPEDPNYPLGSRWMALDGLSGEAEGRQGFGIHGTKKPEEIGTAGSRGCIRMYNGEAIKVYNMLIEGMSQVEVVD